MPTYDDDDDDEEDLEEGRFEYRGARYEAGFRESLKFQQARAAKAARPYQKQAVTAVIRSLTPGEPQVLHLATGGGKTWVANDIVVQWLGQHPGPVLWVTKDWRLLTQAATDLSQRHRNMRLARLGGAGTPLHPLPDIEDAPATRVAYSTVQTVTRRLEDGIMAHVRPCLLVWDECHWGEHGGAGKILTACKRLRIPVLGLTATPRSQSRYSHAFSRTFHELVQDGVLAEPRLHPVKTNIRWTPERSSRFSDISQESLHKLARSKKRNDLIVQHYASNVARYGKTIVFACGIDHVDKLSKMFSHSLGVAASPVHSGLSDEENHRALEGFKSGAVQVLVNADMLTHGVDIPDAQSIFLCRPTTSDILFAQMVGRGSRRAPGKTHFNLVEFTDNTADHADVLWTPKRYFDGTGPGGEPATPRGPRTTERGFPHAFDPSGAPVWIPDDASRPSSLRGLWYRRKQTFGVEIELTPRTGDVPARADAVWLETANALRSALAAALPGRVASRVIQGYLGSENEKDHSVWNIEYDSSAGWEITSRKLQEEDGFLEIDNACRAIEAVAPQLGLGVNHRTGTHIHIGWLGRDVAEVKRAIQLAKLFEPALATLVSPSRIASFDAATSRYDIGAPNIFCQPVSTLFGKGALDRIRSLNGILEIAEEREARYLTFNVKPLAHIHTVEVRLHNGTLEARKILLWVSLWQQILWAAASGKPIPDPPDVDVIRPTGDIIELARAYLPEARQPQQEALLLRLAARRAELYELWKRSPDLAPWLAEAPPAVTIEQLAAIKVAIQANPTWAPEIVRASGFTPDAWAAAEQYWHHWTATDPAWKARWEEAWTAAQQARTRSSPGRNR